MNAGLNCTRARMKVLIFAVFWAARVLCAGQGSAPDSGGAAKVRVLEHRRAEAEVRKDNIALDAMFDNALVLIEDDGTLRSKAEYLSRIRLAGYSRAGDLGGVDDRAHLWSECRGCGRHLSR